MEEMVTCTSSFFSTSRFRGSPMKSFSNIRNDIASRLGLKAKSRKWWISGVTSGGFGVVVAGPGGSREVRLPVQDWWTVICHPSLTREEPMYCPQCGEYLGVEILSLAGHGLREDRVVNTCCCCC